MVVLEMGSRSIRARGLARKDVYIVRFFFPSYACTWERRYMPFFCGSGVVGFFSTSLLSLDVDST